MLERARKLNERYDFSSRRSIDRINSCVDALRTYDCSPTFAVPGIVVERNRSFIHSLQAAGAEIAVHGYNHVDLKAYSPEEASRQLQHAAEVFRAKGLEVHGFRCPYLSATDDLLKAIPHGLFNYSSNKAIQWTVEASPDRHKNSMFATIHTFYIPEQAELSLCLPWFQDGMVEIPVCVPDDLQLHDGLGYGSEQISQIWIEILHQTHRRGEVFNLMFHPELASFCETPFLTVLREARSLQPKVWITQLRDVSNWWREKSRFWVETESSDNHITITFHCSPEATILCRGFEPKGPTSYWDQGYWRLESRLLNIDSSVIPFIGLSPELPQWIKTALQGMGYILDEGETASRCSVYIDKNWHEKFCNPVDLIAYIESIPAQIVRFWPWPGGARSTLCVTGDLDALSFFDYAFRLLKR